MQQMTEMMCKNCKAPIPADCVREGVATCSYCCSVFTVPKKDTSPEALGFIRIGEHELDCRQFGRAYDAYRKAAQCDASEPEAYFGMALSEFKAQYIKDAVNNRLQPICYDISDRRFCQNKNYLKALSCASDEQRVEYERMAKEIDYIRNEFYRLKNAGLSYDCFICAKVSDTDDVARRTVDCDCANDIYYYLRDRGYKPFFSERETGKRTGADYEALILYALYCSSCMLVVCSDEEYLNTPWVKNEYSRFMELACDEEKSADCITLVFMGSPIERLPGRDGKIQGINARSMDAMSRIEAFVRRHAAVFSPVAANKAPAEEPNSKRGFKSILSRTVKDVRIAARTAAKGVTDGLKQAGSALKDAGQKTLEAIDESVRETRPETAATKKAVQSANDPFAEDGNPFGKEYE